MSQELDRPAGWDHEPRSLEGRRVVVAGGTRGIGRATALLLGAHGARLLVFGIHEEELQETVRAIEATGAEVHAMNADQSKIEDVRRIFETADAQLGGVEILINCAAVVTESVREASLEDILYTLQVNVFGYMACCHEALQRMRHKGWGHIVNIGSMSAVVREESSDVYVATKAAIQGFSGSLRKSANRAGIRVTLVEPGLIDTPLVGATDEEKERLKESRKILPAEDIAETVLFCLTRPQRCDVVEIQVRPLKQLI